MKFFVAVTDNDWFRYLRELSDVDEVNFWQPGTPRRFRAVGPGGLFLFKLHWPENFIVGGGHFTTYSELPVSLAWEAFGEKNGAPSLELMLEQIGRYRSGPTGRADYSIGCIVLTQPFFFERDDWIPAPEDFAKNIVTGKTYDLEMETGRQLWNDVQVRLAAARGIVGDEAVPGDQLDLLSQMGFEPGNDVAGDLYGKPTVIRPRLGQGGFRVLVTDTYHRRCAVTGEKALPTLEAAPR